MNKRSIKQHSTSLRLKEGSALHEILKQCAKKIIDDKKAALNSKAITDQPDSAAKLSPKTRQDT